MIRDVKRNKTPRRMKSGTNQQNEEGAKLPSKGNDCERGSMEVYINTE